MELIADGRYSHSGTYNSNVIAAAAVVATMDILARPGVYENLRRLGTRLAAELQAIAAQLEVPAAVQGIGPVLQIWFTDQPIRNYRDAVRHARPDRFRRWWQEMLMRGVLFHPSQDENLFISTAHNDQDLDRTIEAASESMRAVMALSKT
jgi:glutamate-1-semialdehyde 2,1-aminomutase